MDFLIRGVSNHGLLHRLNSELEKKRFLSLAYLKDVLTEKTIRAHFGHQGLYSYITSPTLELLLSRPRLLALLILLKREQDAEKMLGLVKDDTFFFDSEDQVPEEIGYQRDFFQCQAYFPLALTCTYPPQEFPASFQPPFSERSTGWAAGSFGIVRQVRIAVGHLPEHHPQEWFAWKRIDHPYMYSNRILDEVKTLKNRCHKYIVPLVACFLTRADCSLDRSLHLVFPWADMDMFKWMYLKDTSHCPRFSLDLKDEKRRKAYLYSTIISLVSALAYIHRPIDGDITCHHDLKPHNILLFGDVWKISDFGSSRLKSLKEGSQTEREYLGTAAYQPPEYGNVDKHGRAFDVWSMGCIIVELAVLTVYGWEKQELSNFAKDRAHSVVRTATGKERDDDSFRNNMPVVDRWMNAMAHDDGSRNFKYLMKTVSIMLSAEREARPYAWETALFLHAHFYPDEKGSDCRDRMKDLVQAPALEKYVENPYRHNPLVCAIDENDVDLANCLREKGWSLNPPTDTASILLGVNDGALDVVSMLEKFKPSASQIAEVFARKHAAHADGMNNTKDVANGLGHRFAEKLSSANFTLLQIIHFLDRKHPFHPISILTHKLHVDHKDGDQNTALSWAAWSCDAVAVDILLRYGAKVDPINRLKETPLMIASKLGHATVVERLLREKGLKIDFRDGAERTSMAYAKQFGHAKVVRLLRNHGAKSVNLPTAGWKDKSRANSPNPSPGPKPGTSKQWHARNLFPTQSVAGTEASDDD